MLALSDLSDICVSEEALILKTCSINPFKKLFLENVGVQILFDTSVDSWENNFCAHVNELSFN